MTRQDKRPADKARKTVLALVLEIPRDELALRIAMPCIGMRPNVPVNATEALDKMDALGGPVLMGASFRRAADAAVQYFHECVNAGREPS